MIEISEKMKSFSVQTSHTVYVTFWFFNERIGARPEITNSFLIDSIGRHKHCCVDL